MRPQTERMCFAQRNEHMQADKPFLGVCLGLQLLFDGGDENGGVEGLGIIPGRVGEFDRSKGLPVPHIGWNNLVQRRPSRLLSTVAPEDRVYYVHSYRAVPSDANADWVLATGQYGDEFVSVVQKGNVHACQFHPEKSGAVGQELLRNFLDLEQLQEPESLQRPGDGAQSVCYIMRCTVNARAALCNVFLCLCTKQLATGTRTIELQNLLCVQLKLSYTSCAVGLRAGFKAGLARRVIACLDVRSNDAGDLVVTKGDQYDVRESSHSRNVRNLGKPVELCEAYYQGGADEVTFLNITGFRDFPLGDLPMLEVRTMCCAAECVVLLRRGRAWAV